MIENMSQYRCPSCGAEQELFEGNTEAMCEALDIPLLGRIPFDRTLGVAPFGQSLKPRNQDPRP